MFVCLFQMNRGKANGTISQCRYGVGNAFQEVKVGRKDFRRKKMFNNDPEV